MPGCCRKRAQLEQRARSMRYTMATRGVRARLCRVRHITHVNALCFRYIPWWKIWLVAVSTMGLCCFGEPRYGRSTAYCLLQVLRVLTMACHIALTGSFGEIFGGKTTWGLSCPKRVSVTNAPNGLMRRCLLRWQSETSGGAFSRFWQHFLGVSFKGRFLGHSQLIVNKSVIP